MSVTNLCCSSQPISANSYGTVLWALSGCLVESALKKWNILVTYHVTQVWKRSGQCWDWWL